MKVHGKSASPPPVGASNCSSANNSFDNSSDPGSPASSALAPSPRLPDVSSSHAHAHMSSPPSSGHYALSGAVSSSLPPLGGAHLAGSGSLAAAHASNLSEWYVCQSAAGMPTPPSNEHSPIGILNHMPSLHHAAMAQY